jgi:AcrR family transcriptional regulator
MRSHEAAARESRRRSGERATPSSGETLASPEGRSRAAHLGPERRRPLVLDAALALFVRNGYEGTSMEAIAGAAGVSKPVVYDCFPSKERLFTELMAREEGRVMGQIVAAIPADPDLDDIEGTLTRGMTAFLQAVAESPDAYRVILLGEGGSNAAVERRVRRGRQRLVRVLAELARPLVEGPDRERRALLAGHAVAAVAESGARAMLDGDGGWDPDELGRELGRMAARGAFAL